MIVFVGLGNPGKIYRLNRHNIGYMIIDYAADNLKVKKMKLNNKAIIMKTSIENNDVYLVKPLTYMNNSGEALHNFSLAKKISPNKFIIIYDDIYLPFGSIKIKIKGGDGGHKGMASIISYFNTNEIPRIKIGIKGKEEIPSADYAEYVLSNFDNEELENLNKIIDKAYKIMLTIVVEGINIAMNKFN